MGSKHGAPCTQEAVVDPADLAVLRIGPGLAEGLSEALYQWLGVAADNQFPGEILRGLQGSGRNKVCLFEYQTTAYIHVVSPNLRRSEPTATACVDLLSEAYRNIFRCLLETQDMKLRIAPLCSGRRAGNMSPRLAEITWMAIQAAFQGMTGGEQLAICGSSIDLCSAN